MMATDDAPIIIMLMGLMGPDWLMVVIVHAIPPFVWCKKPQKKRGLNVFQLDCNQPSQGKAKSSQS